MIARRFCATTALSTLKAPAASGPRWVRRRSCSSAIAGSTLPPTCPEIPHMAGARVGRERAAARARLRALYFCYLSLDDPLVHTQVVAYLAGLTAQGHTVHLLTYEPKMTRARRRALRNELRAKGISWHHVRYHKRPSLPATIFDALVGAVVEDQAAARQPHDE